MATRSKSASHLSAKSNFFTERNNPNNPGKRRREDGESPPEVTLTPPDRTDSERTITENVIQQNNQQQDFFDEREAVKMDRLVDKKDRYESHIQFLTKCLADKVIPLGLTIQVEPTIGNHNEEFLNKWYEKLNSFSFELMKDVVEFCKSTTTVLSTQIKEVDASIKTKIPPTKYTELSKTLQENQEIRKRHLQQRKIKKFNHLKYKNNHHVPLREGRQQERPNQTNGYKNKTNDRSQSRNRYLKPSYASVLRNKSNTDQRRSNNNNNGNNIDNRNNEYNNNTNNNNNNNNNNNFKPNRDGQIKKLEEQIRELRNQRKNSPLHSKNWGGAPQAGAHITQAGTNMSTKEIMSLIQSTMKTLNDFATRLDNQSSPQIHLEM